MINDYSNLYKIIFWKRSLNSIDEIDTYDLEIKNRNWVFLYNGKEKQTNKDKINHLIKSLENLSLSSWDREYHAYFYEDDKKNYGIKYMLFLENKNHSYIGVKGLYPFKQPNYSEIIDLFENLKKQSL